jgi:hypothetical protein
MRTHVKFVLWLAIAALLLLPACLGASTASGIQSPASSARVPTEPSTFLFSWNGQKDFYRWDGTFMRRVPEATISSVDGHHYVDSQGRIWASGYGHVGAVAGGDRFSGKWAADGDYLCGLVNDSTGSYTLQITDWQGNSHGFALSDTGPHANVIACSMSANRALLLEQSGVTVRSLSDGQVKGTIDVPTQAMPVSADVQLLAASSRSPVGSDWQTTVVGLVDGTVRARLAGAVAVAFMPDGRHLVVWDRNADMTRMVDWRTGAVLWAGPGGANAIALSDPLTDKIVLDLVTGSAEAGTDKHAYWIVDGSGTASRFVPQDIATPAR